MLERREYEMTAADEAELIEACKSVPYIVVGGVEPTSPQENANRAWCRLGERMGFEGMTVEPSPKGRRFFTAVPVARESEKAVLLANGDAGSNGDS